MYGERESFCCGAGNEVGGRGGMGHPFGSFELDSLM